MLQSYEHYRVGTQWGSEHVILLESDDKKFNGFNRLEPARKIFFPVLREKWQNRNNFIQIYIPNRTAIVLCAEEVLAKRGMQVNGRPVKDTSMSDKTKVVSQNAENSISKETKNAADKTEKV